MKKIWIGLLAALLVLMTACGSKDTISVETSSVPDTELTSAMEEDAIETETTDAHLETLTETMSTTKKNSGASDWETAYIEYLKSLNEDSDHVSSLEYVEYAFVTMPGMECPVLVVFGGWRDFYFYTFENGEIVTARQEYEDGEGDLIEAWVDMPVYYLDGCLYFYGGNGAPATIFTNEVSVKDGALQSERVASKLCASAFGDRDYYHGRGEPEITESEYNTIVNNIKEKGKEVEFRSLKDLKG